MINKLYVPSDNYQVLRIITRSVGVWRVNSQIVGPNVFDSLAVSELGM